MNAIQFLYHTRAGRLLLPLLTHRKVSQVCGAFLDSPLSKCLIPGFVRRAGIDLADFYCEDMRCFNDCFSRRIREGLRPVCADPDSLIAPCDGLLKAYPIERDTVLCVKEVPYTVTQLLRSAELAARYEGGTCLVFRLCVEHYHRYCYIETGEKGENVFLPGVLHTVRPAALRARPVFAENCREYTLIQTARFGTILQMEVGAMLVGRIVNLHGPGHVARGAEKGMFQYGGSSIVVLLEKGSPRVNEAYFAAGREGGEVPVRLGQSLMQPILGSFSHSFSEKIVKIHES